MKFLVLYLFVLFVVLCAATSAQSRSHWPHPPEPADKSSTASKSPSTGAHTDSVQLQREARELLELSQSLQPDIESVNHGLLPKDTIEKLKRIEKLSKHLRGDLAP